MRTKLSLALLLTLNIMASGVNAETMDDVLKSPEMDKFHKATGKRAASVDERQWFEKDSNYGKLFLERGGSKYLLEWLGNPTNTYRILGEQAIHSRESIDIERTFETREKPYSRFVARILVPHPKYKTPREMGLLKPFKELEDMFRSAETMLVRGREAQFIQTKDGSCVLLFKIPRDGLAALYGKKCENATGVVSFAESLEWGRFIDKLEH